MSLIAKGAFARAMQPGLGIVMALVALQTAGRPTAPIGLIVNGMSNPLAIDRDTVRFTWRSAAASRGEEQKAFQILVASSAERLPAGNAELYDSGKVDSDQSASVEYRRRPLPPGARFWWKVRVWNQTGKPSRYSAPAWFACARGSFHSERAVMSVCRTKT
jgi:alpha-L-rhamnosidase